jgi:hypothetical protein
MELDIVREIFESRYKDHLALDVYTSYVSAGMELLENNAPTCTARLQELKEIRIALEYREALLLKLIRESA